MEATGPEAMEVEAVRWASTGAKARGPNSMGLGATGG